MKYHLLLLICFIQFGFQSSAQTATAPALGTGTATNPYQIANLNNLYWLTQNTAQWASGKYFIQTADIDASATSTWFSNGTGGYYGFPAIGSYGSLAVGNQQSGAFNARYDGQGFTISNLYINRSPHYVALFGYCNNATIINLNLASPNINVGAAGGSASDGYSGNAILVASGSVTIDNVHITNGTLAVNSWHGYIGGMLGRMSNVTASNSSVHATITATTTYGGNSGGFMGYSEFATSTFTNCYSSGSFTSGNLNYIGGFTGGTYAGSLTYRRSGSSMNITCPNYGAGFTGTVYDANSTFTNCYARGNVTSNNGGGFLSYVYTGTSTFTNCYATGAISGTTTGGFGYTPGSHAYNNCFWDNETSGKSAGFGSGSNAGVTGKTTAEMKTQATFTNASWDFYGESANGTNDYWAIDATVNNGYPSHTGAIRIWNGAADTDWSNSANWEMGILPSSTSIVKLKSGTTTFPVIAGNLTLDRFDFNSVDHIVDLGNYNLTCTEVLGYNANKYIKTSGTGVLKINIGNAKMAIFPVGKSALNLVAIANNSGAADDFTVKVRDEVLTAGTSGSAATGSFVLRTWDIGKTNPNGGSGIDFVFNWNAGELPQPLSTAALFHYGTSWDKQTGTTSSTSTSLTYTGYTGTFSPFAVMEASSTLPVSWLGFTAVRNQQTVQLQWQTATEQNTKDFIVQHSNGNSGWASIGTVTAAGNSQSVSSYNFTHVQPVEGSNYYRLIQRDADGKQSISKTVQVQFTTAARMQVYPTPVTNGVLYVKLPADAVIRLYNSSGSLVLEQKGKAGLQQLQLSQLGKGNYYLRAGTETANILVQ